MMFVHDAPFAVNLSETQGQSKFQFFSLVVRIDASARIATILSTALLSSRNLYTKPSSRGWAAWKMSAGNRTLAKR